MAKEYKELGCTQEEWGLERGKSEGVPWGGKVKPKGVAKDEWQLAMWIAGATHNQRMIGSHYVSHRAIVQMAYHIMRQVGEISQAN